MSAVESSSAVNEAFLRREQAKQAAAENKTFMKKVKKSAMKAVSQSQKKFQFLKFANRKLKAHGSDASVASSSASSQGSSSSNSSNGQLNFKMTAKQAAKMKKAKKAEKENAKTAANASSKPDMDSMKKQLAEIQQTMIDIAAAKNVPAEAYASPSGKGPKKLKAPMKQTPGELKDAQQKAMKEILQALAPSEDINSHPKTPKEFCESIGSLTQIKAADWNKLLKEHNLSTSSSMGKAAKAELLLNHLTATDDED
ncbi:unnamed protein product [Prorocentrum cordatum]|uniref:Uncharacterized protein n=1 Tax=Prorocentrum cordatum TaxID=2364126 RepID=A0ABN9U6K6_9DINO|nr:unnamed protein product [Polarella glacialis]